jgi:DNA-3-methyladenine glycosylase
MNGINYKKLPLSFYRRRNVLEIARELPGKLLVTRFAAGETIGRIVELEAYNGIVDKASHAFGGRRTSRTAPMYAAGGIAYVYLCYGIHHLFNLVTGPADLPHALLIRAIAPVKGVPVMLERTGKLKPDSSLGRGPGNVAKALGISTQHTGWSLLNNDIFIADDGFVVPEKQIGVGPRIGVDYAGEDALLPYRFYIKDNPYLSRNKNTK